MFTHTHAHTHTYEHKREGVQIEGVRVASAQQQKTNGHQQALVLKLDAAGHVSNKN